MQLLRFLANSNMKGITIIEKLVLVIIVILTLVIAYSVIFGEPQTPTSEQEQCSWYANSSVRDLPAKCMKYYK